MSERKVLSKYYPPDFDPAAIQRTRGPKQVGPKVQTVRLMAPFSMKCTSCGEFVYRGRKFNARKETTDEKYYSIAIYRFYIRCTRCGGEITFKTDPKNMDYTCEKGAKRNFEPWRDASGGKEESEEERLDRLEREEEERNAMVELETKTLDAKREMQIADALDEIRTRNARNERVDKGGAVAGVKDEIDEERERIEREDEEIARRAFMTEAGEKVRGLGEEEDGDGLGDGLTASSAPAVEDRAGAMLPPPTFKRVVKKKRDFTSALGIKKKPALV
ncbi:CWC16 protein [Lasallia pustulata]|uniref:Splicing factor YJU2 n=1 Tax=Lasallia pustulata TaxID=136370 RepID=A0A1W5CVW9_9LECA|nr:CWC16 protein [Lasallia pustulata]